MCGSDKLRAFVSWSGGKDAALSYYRVMQEYHITHLVNMVAENGLISRSHGVRTDMLRMQGDAMDLPVIQPRSSWETYENEFKWAVFHLKEEQIGAGVFGDIDLTGHKEWVERVCSDLGIAASLPLWGGNRERILEEFIDAGFEAVIVAARTDMLGPEWLGRRIDHEFIRDVSDMKGVDISGENGEYHTFVTAGPMFKRKINIVSARKITVNRYCYLDITECDLEDADGSGWSN